MAAEFWVEAKPEEAGSVTAGVTLEPFSVDSEQFADQLAETVPEIRSTERNSCCASMTQALCPFASVT
jgi:hypothetical protein